MGASSEKKQWALRSRAEVLVAAAALAALVLPVPGARWGAAGAEPPARCGDTNGDGQLDVSDAIYLLGWLFLGGPSPACPDVSCADSNGDGTVNIADPSHLVNWLFLGGSRPACRPGVCDAVCPPVDGFELRGVSGRCYCEYAHTLTGIVFVLLPQGNFLMGSPEDECGRCDPPCDEGPVHEVTVSRFLIGKLEVTQAEWRRAAELDPLARLDPAPSSFRGGDLPVEQVSWDDVKVFEDVTGLTLPTEAQWEYACRAGSTAPFPTGDTVTTDQANFNGQFPYCNQFDSQGLLRGGTLAAGSFEPNAFGLHDMAGNVLEWCEDLYDPEFYSKNAAGGRDPVSLSGSDSRVLRGGAWLSIAQHLRSAFRAKNAPSLRFNLLGFRAAKRLPE